MNSEEGSRRLTNEAMTVYQLLRTGHLGRVPVLGAGECTAQGKCIIAWLLDRTEKAKGFI